VAADTAGKERLRPRPDLRPAFAIAALLAVVLAVLAGCSKDEPGFIPPIDKGPGSDSTTFQGFLLDDQNSGRLDITLTTTSLAPRRPPLAPTVGDPTVPAHGVLQWPGGNVALSGVYDFTADTLHLAGSGFTLKGYFVGVSSTGGLSGTATSPHGPAAFLASHSSVSWEPWCGRFHATATPDSGTIGFIRADTTVAGMAFQAGATAAIVFQGEVSKSGTPKTLFFDASFPGFTVSGSGTLNDGTGIAGGSYSFDVINGIYGTTNDGTWSTTRR
jgi:hypothetical protein